MKKTIIALLLMISLVSCEKEQLNECGFKENWIGQKIELSNDEKSPDYSHIRFNIEGTIDVWYNELFVESAYNWVEVEGVYYYLFNFHVAWEMDINSECDSLKILVNTKAQTPSDFEIKTK